MTISPPAKIPFGENEPVRVLATGIDTLHLALYVSWRSDEFLALLGDLKAKGKELGTEMPGEIVPEYGPEAWHFSVKPHGAGGYEWLLTSNELSLKIGNWEETHMRPSVMVELRSETLWRMGPAEAVEYACGLLKAVGAEIQEIRPSRVDLCADVLMPVEMWSPALMEYAVTRAVGNSVYRNKGVLTGLGIGKGVIQARLYDKPLEIATRSHKTWMYDKWGIEAVPEGYRVVRVEFQLRREVLKELGADTWKDCQEKADGVWAYCTQNWLRFCDSPDKEHKYRSVLPWWRAVQENFMGVQDPCAAVRAKAVRVSCEQLLAQIVGLGASLLALRFHQRQSKPPKHIEPSAVFEFALRMAVKLMGLDGFTMAEKVKEKLSQYQRSLTEGEKQGDREL